MMHRAWGVLVVGTALAACAAERQPDRAESFATSIVVELPAANLPAVRPLAAVNERRIGGALVAAEVGETRVLLVADADAHALRVVAPDTHEVLASVALRGAPAQVVVGGDGRAYVSLRDVGEVVALELESERGVGLKESSAIPVAAEPVGLAVAPDGATLLVASAWSAKLAAFDIPSRTRRFEIAVPREPRAVAVTADGATAMVSHAVGSQLTSVALAKPELAALDMSGTDRAEVTTGWKREAFYSCCFQDALGVEPEDRSFGLRRPPRISSALRTTEVHIHQRGAAQGFALAAVGEDLLAPGVLTHRGPAQHGSYGLNEAYPAHQPVVAHVRAQRVKLRVEDRVFEPTEHRINAGKRNQDCLLPRAADSDGTRLFVTCLGTDRVVAYTSREPLPLEDSFTGAMSVPAGPTGIVVEADRGWVHVWSQQAQMLSSMRLASFDPTPATPRALAQPERMTHLEGRAANHLGPLARRGRAIFHASGDKRIAADGRACASCHPDGRDDMITWPTPHGPRQTPMLAGRLGETTSPFGWQGTADSLDAHLTQTFTRLGGTGLTGDDLAALLAYLQHMPAPTQPTVEAALTAKGKALFFAETVGCATCHRDATGSDGANHDVGSGVKLDTPSLRFVGGTAPYFHDGRYATLRELLTATKGKMGWASDMDDTDIEALEAYLRTL